MINKAAINHRCAFNYCYAYDKKTLEINLHTGKEIRSVTLIWEDPYNFRLAESNFPFCGRKEMNPEYFLKDKIIWNCSLKPKFMRLQYYFEIKTEDETILMFENDFINAEDYREENKYSFVQFKMAWMNENDISREPAWVSKTVWYQIMPDRFCSKGQWKKRFLNKTWADEENMGYNDFFGGDIPGIIDKLDYLKSLGVNGIYLTPIFKSNSNHKYNIEDYYQIDPDFGTEEDMIALVEKAHSLDIKIMLDAVFNHSGSGFPFWQDVLKNKENSKYKNWFFVNDYSLLEKAGKTDDGRFFTFDFFEGMPKLNTNNPDVQKYFIDLCSHWVKDWKIDAIRFDVANEISHDFVKNLKRALLKINGNLFLLGEIWVDSIQWLLGDEFDSVMNYPFQNAVDRFFKNSDYQAEDFYMDLQKIYSMYFRQTNSVLFNFLDTHDVPRVINSCKDMDELFQRFAVLMIMEGTSCIYYGTEIALEGARGPFNRRCMPWDKIENGSYENIVSTIRNLIEIRKEYGFGFTEQFEFCKEQNPRLLHVVRNSSTGQKVHVYINASNKSEEINVQGKDVFLHNVCKKANKIYINCGGIYMTSENKNELPESLEVNGTVYPIIKLLGKGKGGYSYLAEKDGKSYVVKQIHHEPCSYYTFGNKIEAEKKDYERLASVGVKLPVLYEIDEKNERILKEYVDGPTVVELVKSNSMKESYFNQIREMCRKLYSANLNIDYYPTNFLVQNEILYYVDYECNQYMEEWNFENWGITYWSKTEEFIKAFGE